MFDIEDIIKLPVVQTDSDVSLSIEPETRKAIFSLVAVLALISIFLLISIIKK